jgi:hypothetical protein
MRTRSRAAGWYVAAVLAGVSLAVAGCGQSTKSGPHVQPTGQPSSSGTASGRAPNGTELGSLLTRARLPAGWQELTGVEPEHDSGPNLNLVVGPKPQTDTCNVMDFAASATYFTNWWSVSYASLAVAEPGIANEPIMTLTVAAYQPANDAARTVQLATSLAPTCKSFTDAAGNPVAVSAQTVPGIGSENLYLNSTGQTSAGPLVGQVLLAQTGSYVIGVDTDTGSSGPVSQATVEQFGTWLVNLVTPAG